MIEPPQPAGIHGLHPAQLAAYANQLVAENEWLREKLRDARDLTVSAEPWTESKMALALHDINRLISAALDDR